jgi:hypothetical protein
LTGFAAAAAVEVVVVDVVLEVLELPPQPASASRPAMDSDTSVFRDMAVRSPLWGISW